jgi:hypothetical protein
VGRPEPVDPFERPDPDDDRAALPFDVEVDPDAAALLAARLACSRRAASASRWARF